MRFVLGAHFFHEGYSKWRDPKPFSAPFFGASKGPFAHFFKEHIWDPNGLERLNRDETERLWYGYADRAGRHFRFSEDQVAAAEGVVEAKLSAYDAVIEQWQDDIEQYEYGIARREKNAEDHSRQYTQFQKHDAKIASELTGKRMSWQGPIDKLWVSLEKEINALASPALAAANTDLEYEVDPKQESRGYFKLSARAGQRPFDSEFMDRVIPWFHMTIGVSLVIGLLARWSALGAAAFLGSVIASQWPFTPGTIATNYQQVEFFAALFLAAVGAGNYAGLDAVWKACCGSCCGGKSCDTPAKK